MKITRVETEPCLLGEGPVWDADGQRLYFLDIARKTVRCFDPASGAARCWSAPSSIGSMALRESGGVVLALADGLYALEFDSGDLSLLAQRTDDRERARFNDGKVDRRGRFVIGLSDTVFEGTLPIGGLYSLGTDHRLTMLDDGICFSNSPCFSPDGTTLYFSDSLLNLTYAYDYDLDSGTASNRRVFADTTTLGGKPDGATVDSEGRLWMAIFEAGKVAAFRPDRSLERVIELPVRLVSSVMFGGPDLDRLFVTTIDPAFFGQAAEPEAGSLYVVDGLGVRGLPEPRFAG